MSKIEYGMYVYSNENYSVRVVKMPEMDFSTYGVINKKTDVIEQLQPILYNAQYIADQLNRWLIHGPSSEDEVDSMVDVVEVD